VPSRQVLKMNIDELNIKISSNTKSAKKGIDNLTEALKALSQIDLSNIQSLINGLEKISTAMTGSKTSSSGANGIAETVKETKKLKAVVAETSPKITEIKKTLNEMPSKSISRSLTENELKVIDDTVKRIEDENKRLNESSTVKPKPVNYKKSDNTKIKQYEDKGYYSDNESLKQLREELSLTNKEYEDAFKSGQVHKTVTDWDSFNEKVKDTGNTLKNAGVSGSSSVNKIKGSVTNTTPKIEELKERLKQLSGQGLTFGDSEFDKTYQELQKNISSLKEYKRNLEDAESSSKKLSTPLIKSRSILNALSKAGKAFGKSLLKVSKNALTSGIKPLSEGLKRFQNMLKNMLLRSVLYSGLKAVREGFGQLAKEDTKFNKSMSKMYSALMTLKNAFVAAFAPIVETVSPYITTLLNMLTSVVTKVTQVIASLTGSSSATIAKKLTLDYADAMDESSDSTDKATKSNKEYKNSLMGFDEINKLNGDKSSSSDGSADDNFTTQFTTGGANDLAKKIKSAWENADFTNIGEIISSKIVGMLQGIDWEKIKSYAFKGGKSFATLINGIFKYTNEDGNTLASSVGETVGEAFNTLTNFIYGYVSNFDWENIGDEFGNCINKIFTTVDWETSAKTLSDGILGLLKLIKTTILTIDWFNIGEIIADYLINLDLGAILSSLIETLGALAGGLLAAIGGFLGELAYKYFEPYINAAKEGGVNIAWGILIGILNIFNEIPKWIAENIFIPFIEGICEAFGIASPAKEMKPYGEHIINGLIEGMGDIWQKAKEKFENFKTKISSWFTEKKNSFRQWGSDLVTNIKDGIGDIWSKVKSKFSDFWSSIKNYLGSKTLKLSVEWDTTSVVGQALSKVGLQGLPKLSFYESGGFPNIGELFVANEHGAEMVGSLNNRPAVANNQQIENALENAIYRGMTAAGANGGRSINLNVTVPLDEAVLGRAMVDYHNGYVRITGESPLIIGV